MFCAGMLITVQTAFSVQSRMEESGWWTITLAIDSFCPVSLGHLSQMCAAADVPCVPAELIPEVRKDDYL